MGVKETLSPNRSSSFGPKFTRRSRSLSLRHGEFLPKGTTLSKLLRSADKSVVVKKKWGHPIYVIDYDRKTASSLRDRINLLASMFTIISFASYMKSAMSAKPKEELGTSLNSLTDTIKSLETNMAIDMEVIKSNLEALKNDIREVKEKKCRFKFW
ncbi:unnamed protein product [Camellia sinensis]